MALPNAASFIILCEDVQHESFARRTLKYLGAKGQPRVVRAPGGRGSGEQWVRNRYPLEVKALRGGHVERTLVVVVDADTSTVAERRSQLDLALTSAGHPSRAPGERIILLIPRRNVETWIAALETQPPTLLDESSEFPRLSGEESACDPMCRQLADLCSRRAGLDQPSLAEACLEWRKVFP